MGDNNVILELKLVNTGCSVSATAGKCLNGSEDFIQKFIADYEELFSKALETDNCCFSFDVDL